MKDFNLHLEIGKFVNSNVGDSREREGQYGDQQKVALKTKERENKMHGYVITFTPNYEKTNRNFNFILKINI